MSGQLVSMIAAGLLSLSLAGPAGAMVIGNAETNTTDDIALATRPGSSHPDAHSSIAYNAAFSTVGKIYGTDGAGAFAASSVLVAADWMLTAAHVISGATSLAYRLDGGGTDFSRSGTMSASRIVADLLRTGQLSAGYAVGLFRLSAAVPCLAAQACATAQLEFGSTYGLGKLAVEDGGWTHVSSMYPWVKSAIGVTATATLSACNGLVTSLLAGDMDMPEPAGLALLGFGIAGIVALRRQAIKHEGRP